MSARASLSAAVDGDSINSSLYDRPDIRIANAAIGYVRAFTDCWAFLVNESLPTSTHVNLSVKKAYARWKNAVEVGNPLLTMKDGYNMIKGGGTVEFDIDVNDTNGEHHASAIVLLALDSFMSLLSASDAVQTRSITSPTSGKNDIGLFSIYVPANAPVETLLNCMVGMRGFPAGDTGPFRKWNNVNAVRLSADEQIGDVAERIATVDGDTTAAVIVAAKNINRYLDEFEMERCITLNNKNRKGDIFTVTSDRKASNNRNMEKGGVIAEAAKAQKKKSRRRRDMYANPALLVDKFSASSAEKPSKKRKAAAAASSFPNVPSNQESRYKFTSLTMSAKDFLIAFDSSSSLRGSQRSKSLVGKFISLSKTNFVKNKNNENKKLLSEWISPEDRKLVVVCGASEGRGSASNIFEIRFKVRCSKSRFFDPVSVTSSTLKHLMKLTGILITYLKLFGKEIPKFDPITKSMVINLTKMVLCLVKGVRSTIGFKVPNCISFKNMAIETNKWNSQTFFMGLTGERYNRIIEVFDFMLSRGAFVCAALNSSFFLDAGVRYRHGNRSAAWVNIDLMKVAAECMHHVTDVSRYQVRDFPEDHPITKTNETTRQYLERKMSQPVESFINTSYTYRHTNKIQNNITETGRKALDKLLHTRGAISAFMEGTISVDTRSALIKSKKNKTYWNPWKLEELDTLYGMSDSYKTGQLCSPHSSGGCSRDECGDISRPPPRKKRWTNNQQSPAAASSQNTAQVAANTIVVSSILTYPSLAKATSSKHLP